MQQVALRAVALFSACASLVAPSWSQTVTRLSVDASGAQANGTSPDVCASSDGRWVVFSSAATNLVANDTNGYWVDVFLLDRNTGALELASVDSSGVQHATNSWAGGVSDDGRFIAFISNGLDPDDTDSTPDVYLRDRQTGVTHWVSEENSSRAAYGCTLSRDGRTVAYHSYTAWALAPSYHVRRPLSGGQWDWLEVLDNGGASVVSFSHGILAANGEFAAVQTETYSGAGSTISTRLVALSTGATTNIAGAPNVKALSHDASHLAHVLPGAGLISRELSTGIETVLIPGALPNIERMLSSADWRYFSFVSHASILFPGDTSLVRDIFLHDRRSRTTVRVSLSAAGEQANGMLVMNGALLGDGSRVLFASDASNLVPGDTNGVMDVFERTNCFPHAADLDGDGYGAGAMSLMCLPVGPGFILNVLDCDDARADAYPGAPESCNGLDDDCDGEIDEGFQGAPYCANASSSSGCQPRIEALGSPRASETSGFTVRVTQMNGQRAGMLFYGLAPTAVPWAPPLNPSTMCVEGQRQRMGVTLSSGNLNLCNGVIARDVLAWAAATPGALATPFSAGTTLYFQGWMRDPLMPTGGILTGGWSTTLCP